MAIRDSYLNAEQMTEIPQRVIVNEILDAADKPFHAVAHRLVDTIDEFIHFAWKIIKADFVTTFKQSIPVKIEIFAGGHRILQPLCANDSAEIAATIPNAWFKTFQSTGQIEGIAWTIAVVEQNDITPSLQIGQDLFIENIGQDGTIGASGGCFFKICP